MCATNKKVYAFVGIPQSSIIYAEVIDNADIGDTVEVRIDDMIDLIDNSRQSKAVWATFSVEQVTFAEACAKFGKYMEHRK